MAEEINYSYDGGLYPEMVRNRAFNTLHHGLESWPAFTHGDTLIKQEWDPGTGPSTALSGSLKITISLPSGTCEAGSQRRILGHGSASQHHIHWLVLRQI
jgi:alpha-N-arabinofuranosidase